MTLEITKEMPQNDAPSTALSSAQSDSFTGFSDFAAVKSAMTSTTDNTGLKNLELFDSKPGTGFNGSDWHGKVPDSKGAEPGTPENPDDKADGGGKGAQPDSEERRANEGEAAPTQMADKNDGDASQTKPGKGSGEQPATPENRENTDNDRVESMPNRETPQGQAPDDRGTIKKIQPPSQVEA